MAESVTIMQAAALVNLPAWRIADLCRTRALQSARKERGPCPGQACWWLDPGELRQFLRKNGRGRSSGALSEPWSPIVAPAREGEPSELQLSVLAGEWWHRLLDMRLRENGDLWTRWSDGERYVIHPNGELDQFRYEQIGTHYRQQERKESHEDRQRNRQLFSHAQPT